MKLPASHPRSKQTKYLFAVDVPSNVPLSLSRCFSSVYSSLAGELCTPCPPRGATVRVRGSFPFRPCFRTSVVDKHSDPGPRLYGLGELGELHLQRRSTSSTKTGLSFNAAGGSVSEW